MSEQLNRERSELHQTEEPRNVSAMLAALGAFAGVFAIEVSFLYALDMRGVGLGWIAFPVLAGLWAWRWVHARGPEATLSSSKEAVNSLDRPQRLRLVLTAGWVIGCSVYWFFLDDSYEVRVGAWLAWLIVPLMGVWVMMKVMGWVNAGQPGTPGTR